MAKATAVWGIDLGQCSLKAIRCRLDDKNPGSVIADAFDYIEYPQILTQPEADPVELVREALDLFLSRNDLTGCKVAVSVSGQSGLARFIKLPPVETKKIPDIVRYEANQQIPFDLDDVIWDYQCLFGGNEEDGFALETEVGLFAMKRDQVYQEIEAYREAGIDIDIVQLSPLALYNYVVFDRMQDLPAEDEFDPEDPPKSMVVLSIGTESTDLVITNGYRVWQRSIPLGGSHFTKALVKDLQISYAKAEHLKRNATQAEDPKAIYKAMRPVFKDLLTEIQRSIGYFHSLDRSAKTGDIVAMGNSVKLPGLKRYLSQNLGEDVQEATRFMTLAGPAVTESPAFKDNVVAFGVPYGLALQALGVGRLATNLVPTEMVRDRLVNRKKPWAVAAAVLLALGCLVNFLLLWWPSSQIQVDVNEDWRRAQNEVQRIEGEVAGFAQNYDTARQKYTTQVALGEQLVDPFEHRTDWLNLGQAIDQCLPQDAVADAEEEDEDGGEADGDGADEGAAAEEVVEEPAIKPITEREVLWITDMRSQPFEDLGVWYTEEMDKAYQKNRATIELAPAEGAAPDAGGLLVDDDAPKGPQARILDAPIPQFPATGNPSGPGYVIQLTGYHFHSSEKHAFGPHFVRRTLVNNLQDRTITIPTAKGEEIQVPIRDLGISHPLVVEVKSPTARRGRGAATSENGQSFLVENPEAGEEGAGPKQIRAYKFVVQFAWQPKPLEKGQSTQFANAGP